MVLAATPTYVQTRPFISTLRWKMRKMKMKDSGESWSRAWLGIDISELDLPSFIQTGKMKNEMIFSRLHTREEQEMNNNEGRSPSWRKMCSLLYEREIISHLVPGWGKLLLFCELRRKFHVSSYRILWSVSWVEAILWIFWLLITFQLGG